MFVSAALNVAFGFSTALYFLIFIWATNGYCQSLGWTPSIRVLANWIPVARRGEVQRLVAAVNEQLWVGHFDLWTNTGMIMP